MKQGIHPGLQHREGALRVRQHVRDAQHVERHPRGDLRVCHPYYTGKQKLIDTAGRVERFKQKWGDHAAGAVEELIEEPGSPPGSLHSGE
jgi:large subunit ribosomal protein L31